MDTRPGAAGRALFGYGVDVPSSLTPAQENVLIVAILLLACVAVGAMFIVFSVTNSYMWALLTAFAGVSVATAVLGLLAASWRKSNLASAERK